MLHAKEIAPLLKHEHATALSCYTAYLKCLNWNITIFHDFTLWGWFFDQIKTSGLATDSSKPSSSMSNEITWFSKTHFKSVKLNQNETRFWFIGVFLSLMPWVAHVISKLNLNLSLHSGSFSIAWNWCKINFWTLHVYIHVRCVFWFSRCEFVRFSRPHGKAAWNYKIWGVDFYPISGICMWCNHQTG